MKKTKILFAIWAIVVLIIIILLTVMGFVLESRYEKYKRFEEQVLMSANDYAHSELLLEEKETVVSIEELVELEYLDSLEVDGDVCSGYVIITNDGNFQYDAYIKCGEYKTRGFRENK